MKTRRAYSYPISVPRLWAVGRIACRGLATIIVASLAIVGCSENSPMDDSGSFATTISGTVTDNEGFSKVGEVQDADVSAADVDENGNEMPRDGKTTTDSNGMYTLETDASAEVMILTANKGTFRSQALVANTNGAAEIMAMEVNSETNAEADVYVEAKRQDHQEEPVTPADVALFVNSELAAEIEAGNASSTQVATAIRSGMEAEYRYLKEKEGATQADVDAVVQGKGSAFGQLQADLATGGNASASMETFVSALVNAHAEAGISHASSAEARQTAELVIESLSEGFSEKARFALRQHAHLLAASSTSAAVEAEFDAEPGMDAQASAVADAAQNLRSSIVEATTEAEIEAAWSDFRAAVNAQLTSGLAIGSALQTAIETTIASQSASFNTSVSDATTVDDFVSAKAEFNTQLRTALKGQLSAVADAGFGSRVLTLVSAR